MNKPKENRGWKRRDIIILSLVISLLITVDPDLFSDDHVPYIFYGMKFVVAFIVFRVILSKSSKWDNPRDRKHLFIFAAISAVAIIGIVISILLSG